MRNSVHVNQLPVKRTKKVSEKILHLTRTGKKCNLLRWNEARIYLKNVEHITGESSECFMKNKIKDTLDYFNEGYLYNN
jgi:hypothetical protein